MMVLSVPVDMAIRAGVDVARPWADSILRFGAGARANLAPTETARGCSRGKGLVNIPVARHLGRTT